MELNCLFFEVPFASAHRGDRGQDPGRPLASVENELCNDRFVAGVPLQVWVTERKEKADAEAQTKALEARLAQLPDQRKYELADESASYHCQCFMKRAVPVEVRIKYVPLASERTSRRMLLAPPVAGPSIVRPSME